MAWPRGVSIACMVLAMAAVSAVIVLVEVGAPTDPAPWWFVAQLVVCTPALVLGLLISLQPSGAVVGVLLSFAGLVPALLGLVDVLGVVAENNPALGEAAASVRQATSGAWMLLFLPFALLLLVFPDGRLVSRRWRVVAVGLPMVVAGFCLLGAFSPGAADEDPVGVVAVVAFTLLPVFLVMLAACAGSTVIRYRAAGGKVRIQLRWLALSGAIIPLTLLIGWAGDLLFGETDAVIIGILASYVAIPAAVAVAMFKHDLYDVDRAIMATAANLLIVGGILVVVAATSAVAGLVAGNASIVIAVVVTAITAMALGPTRRAAERWVGRHLYPARDRSLRAIDDLLGRVHAGQAPPEDLQSVLRVALRDSGLQIGYRLPGSRQWCEIDGTQVVQRTNAAPIRMSGREIGLIVPSDRTADRPAADIASAAALLAEMVRLRLELASALKEVAGSRERLLRASYSERRRLEQDLHDGAQQRLVSLGMALRLLQRHLDDPVSTVSGMLDAAVAEIGTAVAELRQIAHGLRPSSLDDGLEAALTNLSRRSAIPIELDIDVGALPDLVSTTAYFVANEAVANAVKHSEAVKVAVCVQAVDGSVNVTISDDGLGGATLRPGSGLAGLVDRVSAVGGGLRVASPIGGGTVVEAVIPCGS